MVYSVRERRVRFKVIGNATGYRPITNPNHRSEGILNPMLQSNKIIMENKAENGNLESKNYPRMNILKHKITDIVLAK